MTAAPSQIRTSQPRVELVEVTPELAEVWLGANDSNRRLNPTTWRPYARDMAAGRWKQTGEAIKLSASGRLLDGQHRLRALVYAGVTLLMVIVSEVSEDAQEAMDSGRKRSASDGLVMRKVPNASTLASVARFAIGMDERPENPGGYPATHAEINDWIDQHPEVAEPVATISRVAGRIKGCRPTIAAYTLWVLSELDPALANEFWASVVDQVGAYPGDPAVALARRFAEARRDRESLPDRAQLSMIYRAWNMRRNNKPMRIVRVMSPGEAGGLIPVPDPR